MTVQFVLLPLFVEVLLTFAVMFGMMYFRPSTLRSGETRYEDISLREPNWLPVLFYVLTILEIITKHADLLFVLLAWVFVVMRILQVGVQVTNNNVRVRGGFYGAGAIVLLIMWIIYIVRIVLALP